MKRRELDDADRTIRKHVVLLVKTLNKQHLSSLELEISTFHLQKYGVGHQMPPARSTPLWAAGLRGATHSGHSGVLLDLSLRGRLVALLLDCQPPALSSSKICLS